MPLSPAETAIAAVLFGMVIWVIGAYKMGDCVRELDGSDRPEDTRKPATGLSGILFWFFADPLMLLLLCVLLPILPLVILFLGLKTPLAHRGLIRAHWPRFRAPLALWTAGCVLVMYGVTWGAIFFLERTGINGATVAAWFAFP